MTQRLRDIIRFRGDRLFNGAVSISWFGADVSKSKAASEAFVFHGPTYHGVQQEDVGIEHGHLLADTASFARAVVRRCYGFEDQPFTLAIAGYGTGKSHLGLTLASLISTPSGETAHSIISALEAADENLGSDIGVLLREASQPCLVIALDGMKNFDLAAEITKQIVRTLKADGKDTKPLDDLRPRFRHAASLIRMSNEEVVNDLIAACEAANSQDILTELDQHDESTYAKVHDLFCSKGMTIRALEGESLSDIIDVTVREYCGRGKPYRCLVVLFDEFGKYIEFATVRPQIAGSGVLQDLFQAIQANAGNACFVGFIQFELSAYVRRVAPDYRNEILRYVTRYQAANRVYLSINLETLIASLIEKRQHKILDQWFDSREAESTSKAIMANLLRWFPSARNHALWSHCGRFHTVIRKGCWPLSPYASWLLFYLASAGKHLQERSALALLGDVFQVHGEVEVPDSDGVWALSPADLWSDSLLQEFISSEDTGQQGSIAHAFASVMARHGSRLSQELRRALCAVVLGSKLALQAADKDEATEALAVLSGLSANVTKNAVRQLQEDYNVLEWDEAFKAFDIIGDAVPRSQFLAFIRQRVASAYDDNGKAILFASRAAEWCDLLRDLEECDFAEENKIATREWYYRSATSILEYLPQQIEMEHRRWEDAVGVDEPRGTIIYTYLEQSRDLASVITDTRRFLKNVAREAGFPALPILVVLLWDENGALGQALAEFAVLEESIDEEDRVRFGNLLGAHKEKLRQAIHEQVESMLRQRRFVTGLKDELEEKRLSRVGTELFTKIYKSPIPFPFDGFSTARGNAADTCQELTLELLVGKLDYEAAIAKPAKAKNRALRVLKETWGIFTRSGDVSRRPTHPVIRAITEKWDDALATNAQRLPIAEVIRQLCRPPHGGNLASLGLLLGVFVASRNEKLVVLKNGKQLAISQWVQDGIFRGKSIDLSALEGCDLILLGEASSEWEALLDEWEGAESHQDRKNCLRRSLELRSRVPVPPPQAYREHHLSEQARESTRLLEEMEKLQNEAIQLSHDGGERRSVSKVSRAAVKLKTICDRMALEKPLWSDSQIAEIQPHYERARQRVAQLFPEWLPRQTPMSDAPAAIGDYKHKMITVIGGNLKRLGLDAQFQEIEAFTLGIIRKAETVAEAHHLLRDVQSWLTTNSDALRIVRIAKIHGLREVGKDYQRKLQGMADRIQLHGIAETRTQLSEFVTKLQDEEVINRKRVQCLYKSSIKAENEIDRIVTEVEDLVAVYEGLPSDLEDLHLMRRALRLYQKCYQRLVDEHLTWREFEALSADLCEECAAAFEEDGPPWPPDETLAAFRQDISRHRKEASAKWIDSIEAQLEAIPTMSAGDANHLLTLASSPPAIVTEPHQKRAALIVKKVEARLEMLSVEWLVEKFKGLPPKAKKEFLRRLNDLSDTT